MLAYEGLRHSTAMLDFIIFLIAAFILGSFYYVWKNAPRTRRFLHEQLHENKPKIEGWLNDPDFYNRYDDEMPAGPVDELASLAELRYRGVLSEEEYRAAKRRVIDGM